VTDLYKHQQTGIARIVSQPWLWLGDEMGLGKTRQAIDGAQRLFELGIIRSVIVLAPASVFRAVWFDLEMGQIAEYLRVRSIVREFRIRGRVWESDPGLPEMYGRPLQWIVGNYEYIRRPEHLQRLIPYAGASTMLILDESLAVKNPGSETAQAVWKLRRRCGRVLELNGTEGGGDTPDDLFYQAKMMDPSILNCPTFAQFRARYAVMGGYCKLREVKEVVDGRVVLTKKRIPVQVDHYVNLDDLWQRLAPYYLRRTKAECLDLPPKIPAVPIEVPLSAKTWKLYKQMREDSVAYLESGVATAQQAGVRALRLLQLTCGFVGGIERYDTEGGDETKTQRVSTEKLDALVEWVKSQGPEPRFVVWSRFRADAIAAFEALSPMFPGRVGLIIGGQTRQVREAALALLNPRSATPGAAGIVGTVRSGAFGLDLQTADRVLYLSNDDSHVYRTQSEDRTHRSGQTKPVHYWDLIAVGPEGQKTLDHAVVARLKRKKDVAALGVLEWLAAIREE